MFVGRVPNGTTQDSLKEYFEEFGEVKEAYVPSPFRGFGFITFLYSQDGRAVLRRSHKMKVGGWFGLFVLHSFKTYLNKKSWCMK